MARPPGPRSRSPLGVALEMRRDLLGFLTDTAARYGDIVEFRAGAQRIVLLNDPEHARTVLQTHAANFVKGRPLRLARKLLGDGLLTTEGELHDQQSRAVQPAFHTHAVQSYGTTVTACAAQWTDHWRDGELRDLMPEMAGLAAMISARTLFGWDLAGDAALRIVKALEEASRLFTRAPIPLAEWLLLLPLPSSRRFHRARRQLDEEIYALIERTRTRGDDGGNALELLLAAQAAAGGAISKRSVRDQVLTLFLTALDTTSIALTWTWYLLSQHYDVEAKLHAELHCVLGTRAPDVADLERLPYTRMVLLEALRLYPPIYAIARQAIGPFRIADYTIPADTLVLVSPFLQHRDARYFPDPLRFDPERWAAGAAKPQRLAFLPFGSGPRGCIGQSYAILEGTLLLAAIARNWQLRLAPGHAVELLPLINLRPRSMTMTLRHRQLTCSAPPAAGGPAPSSPAR